MVFDPPPINAASHDEAARSFASTRRAYQRLHKLGIHSVNASLA
jgi:hypothetical protein